MSFKASLNLDNRFVADLNYCYLEINQDVDSRGRPSSIPKGGKITLEFDTLGNDSITIWAADPVKEKNGSITYRSIDNSSVQKEIKFDKSLCVDFYERFDGTSSASMVTVITIASPKISIDGSKLDNHWHTQFKGAK